MEDLVYKVMNAKKAQRYLKDAKKRVSDLEYEVSQLASEIALMDKQVSFDGVVMSVGELVNRIENAQQNVNYMTYDLNDRKSREEQREAQSHLDKVIQEAEKTIQENL